MYEIMKMINNVTNSRKCTCDWLVRLRKNDPSQDGNELNSNVPIFGPKWKSLIRFLSVHELPQHVSRALLLRVWVKVV